MPSARVLFGHGGVGHQRGMLDQALDAAEAFRQREQTASFEEPLGLPSPLSSSTATAAERAHLPFRERMLQILWRPG